MTRKAAARGRRGAGRRMSKTASRTTTRTGKKTASARAAHPAGRKPAERKRGPARGTGVRAPERAVAVEERETDQTSGMNAESDEELEWLTDEDEDPRSQIVEDDDEWESDHEEEW
jgi:hypothetical protein